MHFKVKPKVSESTAYKLVEAARLPEGPIHKNSQESASHRFFPSTSLEHAFKKNMRMGGGAYDHKPVMPEVSAKVWETHANWKGWMESTWNLI